MAEKNLSDAHFHVPFVEDLRTFVDDFARTQGFIFAQTTTPQEFVSMPERLGMPCNATQDLDQALAALNLVGIRLGLGLHPWWVPAADDALAQTLDLFDQLMPRTRFIGEVGLDFSARRVATKEQQLRALRHILARCAQDAGGDDSAQGKSSQGARDASDNDGAGADACCPRRVLSLHCVHAYDDLLALLRESGITARATCIFHWFSGSSQQLQTAQSLGCCFSVSHRMLSSKRGREYAKAIPLDRLLLETDAPYVSNPDLSHASVVPYALADLEAELSEGLSMLASVRKEDVQTIANDLNKTSIILFSE